MNRLALLTFLWWPSVLKITKHKYRNSFSNISISSPWELAVFLIFLKAGGKKGTGLIFLWNKSLPDFAHCSSSMWWEHMPTHRHWLCSSPSPSSPGDTRSLCSSNGIQGAQSSSRAHGARAVAGNAGNKCLKGEMETRRKGGREAEEDGGRKRRISILYRCRS